MFVILYFTSGKDKTISLATHSETVILREHKVDCSAQSFSTCDLENFPKCIPGFCGRFVTDNLILEAESSKLLETSKVLFKKFNDDSASAIIELNDEALSKNADSLQEARDILKSIQPKLIESIAQRFEISHEHLYLVSSIFYKITNITTEATEPLFQPYVDKELNSIAHYTLIIYLSNFKKEFKGGKFIFRDIDEKGKKKNVAVDGKFGRLLGYTSGYENVHEMEKVTDGVNYFVTLSFSCRPQ